MVKRSGILNVLQCVTIIILNNITCANRVYNLTLMDKYCKTEQYRITSYHPNKKRPV
jgi:hypothetical protein